MRVEEIFNGIGLITVALAVFDLAGVIFDEISWGGSKKELKEFQWQFTKFLKKKVAGFVKIRN